MEELSNKQLQEKLVELGMPQEEASKILTKSTLIATINTLESMKAEVEKSAEVAAKATEAAKESEKAGPEEKENPVEEKQVEKAWISKAHRQWTFWDEQPKVRILVPLTGQEKKGFIRFEFSKVFKREIPVHVSGAIQTVIENGAQYVIPKGVYVEVPEPVAKRIEDKFQQTSDAGRDYLADRIDPRTGHPVSDKL